MKKINVIHSIGYITSLQVISNVENNCLPNTTVLRCPEEIQGFHQKTDNGSYQATKYVSFFVLLNYKYAPEKAAKLSEILKNELAVELATGYGEINFKEHCYPFLLVKGANLLHYLKEIQCIVQKYNFKLRAHTKLPERAFLKIYQSFKILEIDDGLYRDYFDREKIYVQVPILSSNELTLMIRNVLMQFMHDFKNVDLCEINRYNGTYQFIRIHDQNKSLERAQYFKALFLKILDQYSITT